MGTTKNAIYKVDNGVDFDEIHFITKWANIIEKPSTFYTHPGTHPSTIITQDATHRFITDTERTRWNMPSGNGFLRLSATHVWQWGNAKDVPYEGIRINLPIPLKTVLTATATTAVGQHAAGADMISTSQVKIFNPLSSTPIDYVYWSVVGTV